MKLISFIKTYIITIVFVVCVLYFISYLYHLTKSYIHRYKNQTEQLNLYKTEIELLKKAYDFNRKTIDSLTNERSKIKIKYQTKYETYVIKDSIANSLSVDSIQRYWTKRYNDNQSQ